MSDTFELVPLYSVSLRGQSRIQIDGGSLHGLEVDRRSRKSGVVGKAGDNGAGHSN